MFISIFGFPCLKQVASQIYWFLRSIFSASDEAVGFFRSKLTGQPFVRLLKTLGLSIIAHLLKALAKTIPTVCDSSIHFLYFMYVGGQIQWIATCLKHGKSEIQINQGKSGCCLSSSDWKLQLFKFLVKLSEELSRTFRNFHKKFHGKYLWLDRGYFT